MFVAKGKHMQTNEMNREKLMKTIWLHTKHA